MPELFPILLFLHVLGAIVALGPALAFPVIGAAAGREPAHGNFATRLMHVLDDRVVIPFILSTAVTGAAMIWARNLPLFAAAYRWLLVALVVYVVALVFSVFVQRPTVLRVIALTGGFPGAGAAPAAPTGDPGRPAGGPPPELIAATNRSRRNGMVLAALSVTITFLMVVKPGLGF
jgi:hypothetical protein